MQSIEFIELSKKTLTDSFHTNKVEAKDLANALKEFIKLGNILDSYKKRIFYGKGPNATNTELDLIYSYNHVNPKTLHAILGIATEAVELVEAIVPALRGEEVDLVNVNEELGDLYWYCAEIHRQSGTMPEDAYYKNIAKLKKRYPEGFTSTDALNRDLDAERKVLEQE